MDTGPKSAPPSLSTRITPSREVPQSSLIAPKASNPPKCTPKSNSNATLEKVEQPYCQTGHEPTGELLSKRKRSQYAEDLRSQIEEKTVEKRARITSPGCAIGSKKEANDINSEKDLPIEHWRKTGTWPKGLFQPDPNMSQLLTKRQSSSATSYFQGVGKGIYPVAHMSTYEQEILEPAGIILAQQINDAAIGHDTQELCQILLGATYETPKDSLFEGDLYIKVVNSVYNEGEGRVVRDLQPNLVPSAEILHFRGLSEVNYLKETVKMPWSNVVSVAGPTPCPHITVGLLPSAFTEPELGKLHRLRQSSGIPSAFIGDLYFPFFTCEAKMSLVYQKPYYEYIGLKESGRQNARSAATAIKVILGLYQRGEETRLKSGAASGINQLHREILFFSISHDHNMVWIFGHYPLINQDKVYFHRHVIIVVPLLSGGAGITRWTTYNFVRKLYDHFAPIHLQRIRDAIRYLPESISESFMATDSAEGGSEFTSLQGTTGTHTSMEELKQQFAREMEEREQQRKEREQQWEEDRQQYKQQLARAEEERQQRHAEIMEQSKKLIALVEKRLAANEK
ncbi:MAG: hypothetical protein Q9163_002779 [Psora crenata]